MMPVAGSCIAHLTVLRLQNKDPSTFPAKAYLACVIPDFEHMLYSTQRHVKIDSNICGALVGDPVLVDDPALEVGGISSSFGYKWLFTWHSDEKQQILVSWW
jgi:hypothetical protein